MSKSRKSIKERLEAMYIPEPNTGCWIWLGSTTKSIFGWVHQRAKITVGRRTMNVTRLAYESFVGEIPRGLWVLHKCDTPLCINPNHLYVGTRADNVRDRVSRGRSRGRCSAGAKGAKGPTGPYNVGGSNGMAKLDEAKVRAIRADPSSAQVIAARYGVSSGAIRDVKAGRNWNHVQ